MRAANEPAHRPEFFTALMDATVFILGTSEDEEEAGAAVLPAGSQVNIQHWEKPDGTTAIPFFSSLEALQQAISDEQAFLALPARALFELTTGETLFLNPKLLTAKSFCRKNCPYAGGRGQGLVQSSVVEEQAQLVLRVPSDLPAQMIDSLTQLFAKHGQVRRAWLSEMQEGEDVPHLLIGLEMEPVDEAIIQAAGTVASDT